MLKYLIIQLSDSAPSFCHYQNGTKDNIISLKDLERGIIWSMKQNVSVQIIYPRYGLNDEYKKAIDRIDHVAIVGSDCSDKTLLDSANIITIDGVSKFSTCQVRSNVSYVLRVHIEDFLQCYKQLIPAFPIASRLNIVFDDVNAFTKNLVDEYRHVLEDLTGYIKKEYVSGHSIQFNLLTDRFMLDEMNNCNAGYESVTLTPDGRFYACPAFYFDKEGFGLKKGQTPIGDLNTGLDIRNPKLYQIGHAPLCRICDAYHCKRCVWLNRKMTYEVNTPSHEQCVMAHIERNASRLLLQQIQEKGRFLPDKEIKEIDYLDPFEIKPTL